MKRQLLLACGCIFLLAGWLSAFLMQSIPQRTDLYYLVPALLLGVGMGLIAKFMNIMRTVFVLVLTAIAAIISVNQLFPQQTISINKFLQRMHTEVPVGQSVVIEVPVAERSGSFATERTLVTPAALKIQLFSRLPGPARMLAFDRQGRLYVSIPKLDAIYQLSDQDGDGFAEVPVLYHAGLDRPHGLVWSGGALYVAETSRLLRLRDTDGDNQVDQVEVLLDDLPDDGGHSTRSLALGGDGYLYLSIGSRCNACEESDPRRAAILRVDPVTGQAEPFARGLRNTVGLAFDAIGDALWGSDNGRDMLGDDLPPDEINHIVAGGDYGWPFCFGAQQPDPQLTGGKGCAETQPAAVALQAHSAPLGIAFGDRLQAPAEFRDSLYVALHGSWNRSVPTGYKLIRIPFKDGRPSAPASEFIAGWLTDGNAWGRPVAPLVGADGNLYLSDDRARAVYRISWPQE